MPPSNSNNEAPEDCPICLEKLPKETWRGTERARALCCGKMICESCVILQEQHFLRLGQLSDGYQQFIESQKCPMCRTDLPRTSQDRFNLIQKNVKEHPNWGWAHYKLGKYFETGTGCRVDPKQAFKNYQKGAELGNMKAQHELGNCYLNGSGVIKSEEEAMKCYRKSADVGYAYSMWTLGQILSERGRHSEAFQLFKAAADLELPEAECSLAYCYESGEGVHPPSLEKSIYWNKKAAEGGNVTAMLNYGANIMQLAGLQNGGRVDVVGKSPVPEALWWARKAFASGERDAMHHISQLEDLSGQICGNCQKVASAQTRLSRCAQCKAVSYCSRDCQANHWKKGHKRDCVDRNGVRKGARKTKL